MADTFLARLRAAREAAPEQRNRYVQANYQPVPSGPISANTLEIPTDLAVLLVNNAEKLERVIEIAMQHPHNTVTSNGKQVDAQLNCKACAAIAALDDDAK